MARKGTGRQKHLADMSLPPDQRGRRSSGRAADPVPAQMQRGNTRYGRARRRDWERKMNRERGGG